MNRPADANTASCPKLSSLSVSGDEFNMKRKPQGKNCISTKVFKRRREIIRVSLLKIVLNGKMNVGDGCWRRNVLVTT